MKEHRSTQDTVSKQHPRQQLQPIDAIESLHAHLVKIEAIALVACEAADQLRSPSGQSAKRVHTRMRIFVGQAAMEAVNAVAHADRLMGDLRGICAVEPSGSCREERRGSQQSRLTELLGAAQPRRTNHARPSRGAG
jgi:hypothetical protein